MNSASLTTVGGTTCPVCYEAALPAADLSDYQLFRCPKCGCWSSDALFRGAEVSFETSDYFTNAELDRGKWEALFARMKKEGRSVSSVLDVGCGTGAFLSFVGNELPDCRREGIEIDPGRAGESRSRNPGVTVHEGDASDAVAAGAGPFDLITLWDVFEHVTAPAELLDQLAKCLAPGGIIHIVTINERSLMPMIGRMSYTLSGGRVTYPIRRTHEPHHLSFFTNEGLDLAAARAGLQIRDRGYDRLLRGRMDGHPAVTALTASLLWLENVMGNGLFVNLILEARS
ncbi:MAG: class I SAM-dependent methyltransferase [Myxococcota bacterium]|nr:class I SAM-dependent methyltransferase [Myxococcota bacterium]